MSDEWTHVLLRLSPKGLDLKKLSSLGRHKQSITKLWLVSLSRLLVLVLKKQKQEFYEERNIGLAFQDSYLPQSRQWGYILNFFGPPFISCCSCRNCYCFSCVFQGEWFWCLVFSFVLSERQQLLQRDIKRIPDHFSTQTTVTKDVTSMVLRTKAVSNEELLDISLSLSLSLVGGLV